MKRIELLSPAGNMECLKAAIHNGADAVYLGGKQFGARAYASNFTNEEMVSAINYCHLYGVKIYVTVNTLIKENEIKDYLEYIKFLHLNGVDAVIMQDLGMINLVHKTFPHLEIHASTQCHTTNDESLEFLQSLGCKRAVLAREMTINEIKSLKSNVQKEIFVQGALCISYSGQCLMSALIGNRSGNRGSCAGSCRQKYNLIVDNKKVNEEEYLLSTKDLCALEDIGKLIDLDFLSFKIEGFGGVRELTIPSELAYGSTQEICGGTNSPLKFVIKAIEPTEPLATLMNELALAQNRYIYYANYGVNYDEYIQSLEDSNIDISGSTESATEGE